MKKTTLKVGDLVKDKWASANKVPGYIKTDQEIYIPAMGIIKSITLTVLYKTKIVKNEKQKIPYEAEVAEIEWMEACIPQFNAKTNCFELDYYKNHKTKIEIKHLTLFNDYYKSFLKRWTNKKLNTKNSP